jgi:hypothetical protein
LGREVLIVGRLGVLPSIVLDMNFVQSEPTSETPFWGDRSAGSQNAPTSDADLAGPKPDDFSDVSPAPNRVLEQDLLMKQVPLEGSCVLIFELTLLVLVLVHGFRK